MVKMSGMEGEAREDSKLDETGQTANTAIWDRFTIIAALVNILVGIHNQLKQPIRKLLGKCPLCKGYANASERLNRVSGCIARLTWLAILGILFSAVTYFINIVIAVIILVAIVLVPLVFAVLLGWRHADNCYLIHLYPWRRRHFTLKLVKDEMRLTAQLGNVRENTSITRYTFDELEGGSLGLHLISDEVSNVLADLLKEEAKPFAISYHVDSAKGGSRAKSYDTALESRFGGHWTEETPDTYGCKEVTRHTFVVTAIKPASANSRTAA